MNLPKNHRPLTDVLSSAAKADDFLLSGEQIDFFPENDHLSGVEIPDESRVESLRALAPLR
jgi:hypothetical protein